MDKVCGFSEDIDKPSFRFHRSKSFYSDEYLPRKTLHYFFQPTNKADYAHLTGGDFQYPDQCLCKIINTHFQPFSCLVLINVKTNSL